MTDIGFEFEFEPDAAEDGETGEEPQRRRKIRVWPQADEGYWLEHREETEPGSDEFRRTSIQGITDTEFRKIERPAAQLDDARDPAAATDGGPRDD
jgi:hypothetical protein